MSNFFISWCSKFYIWLTLMDLNFDHVCQFWVHQSLKGYSIEYCISVLRLQVHNSWTAKTPPSLKSSHITYNDETWHSYTLPKENPKIYESLEIPQISADISIFFARSQQILLYQEIDCVLYIISNSFNFSWVFKDFFNKPSYNFDDVSKNSNHRHL